MIPPPAQRARWPSRAGATVSEAPGSHAIYVSQPRVVSDLIAKAARSLRERSGPSVDHQEPPRLKTADGRQASTLCRPSCSPLRGITPPRPARLERTAHEPAGYRFPCDSTLGPRAARSLARCCNRLDAVGSEEVHEAPAWDGGCRGNSRASASAATGRFRYGGHGRCGPDSGCSGCQRLVVELHQVVGGRDQAPLGARGRSASSVEAAHPAIVLCVPEHRLDCL
jgi:hypothetical protein